MTEIEHLYTVLGGRFIAPITDIQRKLDKIKAFVLDWDGVFNNGHKTTTSGSGFSEVDSMGLNLLRFAYYRKNKEQPVTAILSGEKNDTAFYYSEREGLKYSFSKIPHKIKALEFLCKQENLKPEEVAYFFDDVLDVPLAEKCGLRMMVNQKVNPLFVNYCKKNHLVDYLTSSPGGQFAVREATELLIGLYGEFDNIIDGRKNNTEEYQSYIKSRREVKTQFFTLLDDQISRLEKQPLGFKAQ
jgi:3-deoxy-D-manno-octulosonate 8-phosphate phosphatase (KDO 8-P phosphatase)